MPPNHLETRMDTGFAVVSDASKSASSRQSRRGLSDAAIRAAKPSEKAYKLPAGGSLYLEVSPTGAKLWRWKYRLLGKESRAALGRYPDVSLRDAREAAESARKLVAQGIHPAQQKKLERLKTGLDHANTFEAVAREWVALRDWQQVTKARRLNMLERVVFPHVGSLPIRQVQSLHVLDILKRANSRNGNSVAREAKRTMSSVFEFAVSRLLADMDPVYPVRNALPANKTQHKRPLSFEEVGALLNAVEGHGGYYQIQAAFFLMWLTLARPSEVIEAEWCEFDLDAADEKAQGALDPFANPSCRIAAQPIHAHGQPMSSLPPPGRQEKTDGDGIVPADVEGLGLGRQVQPACHAHHGQHTAQRDGLFP